MAQAENRWAVVIGISAYQNPRANLKYPAKDAMTIYELLNTNGYFPKQNIRLLLNDQATKANITEALRDWLPARAVSGDIVVIYYSGHGVAGLDLDPKDESDGKDEYLAPYDVDISNYPQSLAQTGVRDDLIAEWLGKLQSDNVVILDNCYSGGGIKSLLTGGTPKSLDHLLPLQSGVKSLPTGGMNQEISGLAQRVTFLAASLPSQRAWEDPDLKQSVFTYYLARGLQGNADMNGDRNISVSEAFNYTQQQIASDQKWGPLQQPVMELKKDLVLVSLEPGQITIIPTATPTPIPTDPPTPVVHIEPTPSPTPKPTPVRTEQAGKIKVDLWFDVLQADGTVKPGIENEEYRSGETLKLSFRVAQDCYLFAFNIDQNGNVHNIYPSDPQADESVRVEGNRIYRIRGTLDNIVGEERFFAVASEYPFSLSRDVLPEVLREFRAKNLQVGQMKDLKIPLSYATTSLKHR